MWRALFRNLHCNRSLQEKLFAEIPNPPHKYWIQWLVLEENVPLPSVRLPSIEIESLWGVDRDVLDSKVKGRPICQLFLTRPVAIHLSNA